MARNELFNDPGGNFSVLNVTYDGTFGGNLNVAGNLTIGGTINGSNILLDLPALDLMVAAGVQNLTNAEVKQLLNLGATTISAATWSNLSGLDQKVSTSSTPSFASINVASGITRGFAMYDSSGNNGLTYLSLAGQDGNIPISAASGQVYSARITGTTNRVTVAYGAGTLGLNLPQDIHTGAVPGFAGLGLTGDITSTTGVFAGVNVPTLAATVAGLSAGSLVGTTNQVVLTTVGSVTTFSTPQSIGATSSPTFAGATFTGLTASLPVKLTAGKALLAAAIDLSGVEVTSILPVAKLGISAGASVTLSGAGVINTVQAITTASSPSFAGVTSGSITGATVQTAGALVTRTLTDGQLIIGTTGLTPSPGTIGGTTDQINVTVGAGTITLTTPQAIGLASTPTFSKLTLQSTTSQLVLGDPVAFHTTLNAIAPLGASRTVTLPDPGGADSLALLALAQTFTNKSLSDSTTLITNVTTASKALKFDLSGATASTTMTIASSQTTNRTLTLPDATDTLVGKSTTDTLTNKNVWGSSTWSSNGSVYQTGTVTRSGSTITGTGTTFTLAMVGGSIRFSTSGEVAFITAFGSSTSLLCDVSGTVASQAFAIRYDCISTDVGGQRLGLPATLYRNGFSISIPTLTAADQVVLQKATQVVINKNFDSTNVFSLNTDNTRTVTIVPLNANGTNMNLWFNSTIARSYFFTDPGADANVVMSEGNATINGIKTFGTSIKLATSGGTAGALDFYETGTIFTGNATGPWASRSTDFTIDRIGTLVTISWATYSAATTVGTNSITISGTIPARFRPNTSRQQQLTLVQNGVAEGGYMVIGTGGSLNINGNNVIGNFTGTAGFQGGSVSYRI
jgi:hypothetical protein